jgi:DNA polymerase-1
VSADYSQIELRIMAHLSEDKSLIAAFENSQDVHSATAAEIFGISKAKVTADQRRTAKVINFGLIYGMSPFGLSKSLGITIDAAKTYIDKYFMRYPMVASFMENTKDFAKKNGYVQTVFGRKLWLPEINSPNGPRRQASERAAINAPMQGTAADLIKIAMINVHKSILENGFLSKMILQVHDELVFETPSDEIDEFCSCLKLVMCSVAKLNVPLEVDIGNGQNWEQAH